MIPAISVNDSVNNTEISENPVLKMKYFDGYNIKNKINIHI